MDQIQKEQVRAVQGESDALAVYNAVHASGDVLSFAKDYFFDQDYKVARNAMWAITKGTKEERESLQPLLDKLIDQVLATDNSSVCRLSLNTIDHLELKEEELRTDFLDFCLEHAVKLDENPGIQSLCLKQAYKMCKFYEELMGELIRILKTMDMEYYSPAVKSVRRRILDGKFK